MKVFSPSLICAGLLLSALTSFADTVTLKSGEVLNGTVISEDDQEIVMDVTIASGISDQKKIAKADVQSVTKTTADQADYEPLKNLAVGPRSLPLANYDAVIKSLQTFLTKHPESTHAADIKAKIDAFKQDQAQVKTGSLKWNNRWYKPAEIEKNKVMLGSEMLLATMKDQAARHDFIGALNSFDAFEKSYAGTPVFPDAVELAQSQMRVAASEMERIKAIAKVQDDQFNNGIQLVGDEERARMQAARKAQLAAAEAAVANAEKSQIKWKPLVPLAPKSFDTLKATLTAEAPRIMKISAADMRKSLALIDEAEVALKANNPTLAQAKLKEAEDLWKANGKIAVLTNQLKSRPASGSAPAATPSSSSTDTDTAASTDSAAAPSATPSATPKAKRWFGF